MDQQTAEVITIAIEQQKQNAVELAHEESRRAEEKSKPKSGNSENIPPTNEEEIQQLAEQVQSGNANGAIFGLSEEGKSDDKVSERGGERMGISELPKDAAHKNFALDPSLKVSVGLVADIVGPKVTQQDYTAQNEESEKARCSRCKKAFPMESGGKTYKLCEHCRALQRERSRRWQQKIKQKDETCRRCGTDMRTEDSKYVLCAHCRLSLRTRKANRYQNGKCVHCSGVNDSTQFKVCNRCRENDKQRRLKLEGEGRCNRCAVPLSEMDTTHKVCYDCRTRKKRFTKNSADAVAAAAAAAAHRAVQPIHATIHDLRTQVQHIEPSVEANNEIYQQQVAEQLEANLFAAREAVQQAQPETSESSTS